MSQVERSNRKSVRLVPIPYSNPPVERDVASDQTVRQVVRENFPEARDPLMYQDGENKPISGSTRARDVNEVRFMPYTEGYEA